MSISDDFEPIPRQRRGCLSALCWVALTEILFVVMGTIFGAMVHLADHRMDGWITLPMALFGVVGLLVGLPFGILLGALIWRMD